MLFFPLIYLLNILQFVLIVDTAAGADFCDKSTIFVYINFRRCSIIFSLICFLLIYSLKHNNQSVQWRPDRVDRVDKV